jgi:HSP20 family molecular chaperone IbpA
MSYTNNVFETILNQINTINSEIANADKVNVPMNIIQEEDGSSTIEVAVVGKTKDDIKVKGTVEDGKSYLIIESKDKVVDAEAESKRVYTCRKIKGFGKLALKIFVPVNLAMKDLTAKVENGLLTVNIPVTEEARAIEFDVK